MIAKEGTFTDKKNRVHPVLGIYQTESDKYPIISFGHKRARRTLEALDEFRDRIEAFIEKHDNEPTPAETAADDDLPF